MAGLIETGPDGARVGDMLLAALDAALAGAIGDVFTVSALTVALSLITAMFLRTPARAHHAMQPAEPVDPARRSLVLRNVLTAFSTVVVLLLGVVGMRFLVGSHGPLAEWRARLYLAGRGGALGGWPGRCNADHDPDH